MKNNQETTAHNFFPQNEANRDEIEVLAEEFATLCRAGEPPSPADFAAMHPGHEQEILSLFPSIALMERLKLQKRPSLSGSGGKGEAASPPEWLGDFRILREVGRGGMGIVYEAEQMALSRNVAVKVLPRHALLEPLRLLRFEREAQAAARLHHTNIVPVFGVGEHDGLHFLVMPFIHGEGLDELAARWKSDDDVTPAVQRWKKIAEVGLQAAEALAYAHTQGVLHRDIKPSNLLLDRDGVVWVSDFGLAKFSEGDALTASGDLPGTLRYMAPERFQGQADAQSDVYSLGLTLYELLTLEPAFGGSSPSELIRQVSEGRLERPRRKDPRIHRDLETIILKAVAREPAHRYESAKDLAEDLRRYLEDRPVLAKRAGPIERAWRWCRRKPALAALGVTAASSLALAAVVGWGSYVVAREALGRESVRRDQAEKATERAEKNVSLSLETFEALFDTLSPRSFTQPPPPPGRDNDRPPPPPGVGEDDEPPPPPEGPGGRGGPGRGQGIPGRDAEGPRPGGRGGGDSRGQLRPPRPGYPQGSGRGPNGGSEKEAALLQTVLTFYDKFAEQNDTNPYLKREAAKAYRRVGDLQRRLGRDTEAATAFNRAIELFSAALNDSPRDGQLLRDLAEIEALAAEGTTSPESFEAAEARLVKVRARIQPLAAARPEVPEFAATLARLDAASSLLFERAGKPDEAENRLRNAIELTGKGLDPTLVATRTSLRERLATSLEARGKHAEALAALRLGSRDLRVLSAEHPDDLIGWLIPQYIRLAEAFRTLGDDESANTLDTDVKTLMEKDRPGGPQGRGRRPGPGQDRRPPPPRGFDGGPGGP